MDSSRTGPWRQPRAKPGYFTPALYFRTKGGIDLTGFEILIVLREQILKTGEFGLCLLKQLAWRCLRHLKLHDLGLTVKVNRWYRS